MKKLNTVLASVILWLVLSSQAYCDCVGQFASGAICNNPNGVTGPATPTVNPVIGNSSSIVTVPARILSGASTTSRAGINFAPGTAPTSPVNGDFWDTTAGFFGRVNGITVGPFLGGGVGGLPNGTIWIGDSGNIAVPRTIIGDVTISNTGVATLSTAQAGAHTWAATQTFNGNVISNSYGLAGVTATLSPGPSAAIGTFGGDFFWGTTADIATMQTYAGIWVNRVSLGSAWAKSFGPANNSAGFNSGPNSAGFFFAYNNNTNNAVASLIGLSECPLSNTVCFGANFIFGSSPGATNVVGSVVEDDLEFASGQTAGSGTIAHPINVFSAPNAGPAIQLGGLGGGTWQFGLICYDLEATIAPCLTGGAGTTMGSLFNSGASNYSQDAGLFSNQHKMRFAGTASAHAKSYNSAANVFTQVMGSAGFSVQNNADNATFLFVAPTGQVGIGTATPATDISGLAGAVVRNDGNATNRLAIINAAAGAFTSAQVYFATGTSDSVVSEALLDQAGTPAFQVSSGSAVGGGVIYDFVAYQWASQSGATWAALQNGVLAVGANTTLAGGLRLYGGTSGNLLVQTRAAAGTPVWTAGTSSGTPVVALGSNDTNITLSLDTATGILTPGWIGTLANARLTNPATTVNGQTCTLGSTCAVTAAAGTLTGSALASSVTASSISTLSTNGFASSNNANASFNLDLTGGYSQNMTTVRNFAGFDGVFLVSQRAHGTLASPTIVSASDVVSSFVGRGYDGATYRDMAYIQMYVDGSPGAGSMPGGISFSTTPSGTVAPVNRMFINNSGVINISNIAGTGSRPVCVTAAGNLEAGSLSAGLVTCP